MQEYKWEVKPFAMQPMVFTQCITKEDLKDP